MLETTGMMLYLLLQLLSFAATQSTVTTSSTSTAPYTSPTISATTASAVTHTVDVAKGGFTFIPDITLANVGDYVEFNFFPTNHSVVRAEYGYPCIPYEDTGVDKMGFFSGFRPVDAIISTPPTFTAEINDTNPVFFYCSAPGSCIGYGMVGVINPNASTSLVTQRQLARNSTFMLQPGEPWPSEGPADPFTTTAATTTTTTTPSSTTTAATSSLNPTASTAPAKSGSSLSGGAIAGIAIGGAAVVLTAAALLYVCGRRSRRPTPPDTALPQPHQSPSQTYSPQAQTFSYAPPQSQSPHQPYPYPPPGFGYAPPQMSEQKAAATATDVATFNSTQRFSSPPPGYVPAHDSYSEAASSPVHEMYAPAGQNGPRP